jgi:hypothetical protein
VNTVMNLVDYIKGGELLDQVSNYKLLKEDSVPCMEFLYKKLRLTKDNFPLTHYKC